MANGNQPHTRLTGMADMLFVPMLFYVLTQWGDLESWVARGLWFGLFILIQNELISVRESYKAYNLRLYLLDLVSILLTLFAVHSLTDPVEPYGYNPVFWYQISGVWLSYMVWDFVMADLRNSTEESKQYRRWGFYMAVAFVVTLGCAMLLSHFEGRQSNITHKWIFVVAQVVPSLTIFYAVLTWILDMKSRFESGSANEPS